jgi:hypothetical protein
MNPSPSYVAALEQLERERWVCLKCIVSKTIKPGQQLATVTALTYRRLGILINKGMVEYSSKELCRSKLCKSRFGSMVHRLTPGGVSLKKSANIPDK